MADTIEETTGAYSADPKFQEYYNAIAAQLSPQTIDYTAPSLEEIAAQISGYLRPSTDAQIKARRQATIRQRAATDADAASRGMLPSTWVTDYKNRLAQQENSDIADVEAAYRAQLLQGVAARQQDEANRAYQIAMFNAQMRQAAEADAYQRAGDMYQIYLNGQNTGGGSSTPAVPTISYDDFLKAVSGAPTGSSRTSRVGQPQIWRSQSVRNHDSASIREDLGKVNYYLQ